MFEINRADSRSSTTSHSPCSFLIIWLISLNNNNNNNDKTMGGVTIKIINPNLNHHLIFLFFFFLKVNPYQLQSNLDWKSLRQTTPYPRIQFRLIRFGRKTQHQQQALLAIDLKDLSRRDINPTIANFLTKRLLLFSLIESHRRQNIFRLIANIYTRDFFYVGCCSSFATNKFNSILFLFYLQFILLFLLLLKFVP